MILGKIYVIECDLNCTVYIGSTINTLQERLSGHYNKGIMAGIIKDLGKDHFIIRSLEEKSYIPGDMVDIYSREGKWQRKYKEHGICLYNIITNSEVEIPYETYIKSHKSKGVKPRHRCICGYKTPRMGDMKKHQAICCIHKEAKPEK